MTGARTETWTGTWTGNKFEIWTLSSENWKLASCVSFRFGPCADSCEIIFVQRHEAPLC